MDYGFAETGLQTLLDLINKDNGQNFSFEEYNISAVTYIGKPTDPGINTRVMISHKKLWSEDRLEFEYHRLIPDKTFGTDLELELEGDYITEEEAASAVKAFFKGCGFISADGEYKVTYGKDNIYAAFGNSNYVIYGSVTFYAVTARNLKRKVKIKSIDGYLEGTTEIEADTLRGYELLYWNINKLNGTELNNTDIYADNLKKVSDVHPTHVVDLRAKNSTGPYQGEIEFHYSLFPYDVERPDGIDAGEFADFDSFISTVNNDFIIDLLLKDSGYKFTSNNLQRLNYEQSETYPHFRVSVKIINNQSVYTEDKLYLNGRHSGVEE